MAMKKIKPKKRKVTAKNLKLMQARVDRGLFMRLKTRLAKENVYIQDFLTAAIESYLSP